MAIIVEEEKKNSNVSGMAGLIGFFIIILVAVYYVFFAPATSVIVQTPNTLMSISPISQININTDNIMNNKLLESLKQYVLPLQVASTSGRSNPLLTP